MIGSTHVGIHNTCGAVERQHRLRDVRRRDAFSSPQTSMQIECGKNRFNPNFVPDSSFVCTEVTCNVGDEQDDFCGLT